MTTYFVRTLSLSVVTLFAAACSPPASAPGKQTAALAKPKADAPPRFGAGIVPAGAADPNTLKVGSATMTAPLYVQDCDGNLKSGTRTPNWCLGGGFNLIDNTGGGVLPRYYAQSANINVQLDTTLVDDRSALDFAVPMEPTGIPGCSNGICCDDSGSNCKATTDFWARTIEGDKGEYRLTVEAWKPFCGLNKTPNCLNQDPNTYQCYDWAEEINPQIDPHQPTIPYNNSPDGTRGCWVPMSSFDGNLFSSGYGPPNSVTAPKDGTVSQVVGGPMQLVQAATYLRSVVSVQLDDTRTGDAPPSWDNKPDYEICYDGQQLINCECDWGNPEGLHPCPFAFQGPFSSWHPRSGGFKYSKAFNPFQVVVIPVALAQLKVTPYTIVYQPPGDFSQATFRVSTSYAVAMSAGNAATTTNTTAVDNSGSVGDSMGMSASGKGGNDPSVDGVAGSFGINVAETTKWDHNTSVGVGRSITLTNGASASWSDSYKWTISDSTQTPGTNGAYGNEPFWDDLFVFVIHPQYAFWSDLAGRPTVTLLGALGTQQNPDWFELPVRALDACFRRTPGSGYENGIEIPDTNGERLTSDDCYQFLQLDPFWTVGQSIPRLTDLTTNDARAQFLTASDYGVPHSCAIGPQPCGSDLSFTLDEVNTMTTTQGLAVGGTFSSAISDMVGSSSSSGFSLGLFGITGGGTFTDGEMTTTTNKMDFSLTESVTATSQQSTELIGVLDDHHGLASDKGPGGTGTKYLANTARAYIYKDKLFGSFMFQDKDAPRGPSVALRLTGTDLTVQADHKFSLSLETFSLDPNNTAPISFTVITPPGIAVIQPNPTVARDSQLTLNFQTALGVPLGKQTISVIATGSDVGAQASLTLTTVACVPLHCSHMCGRFQDGCGGLIWCSCAQGESCNAYGVCSGKGN